MRVFLFAFFVLLAFAPAGFADAVLRAGDPLDLKISGVPSDEQAQVNNTYTVDANGTLNMPYINKVRAEGLTPAQLASAI
ncbi:MAG: polysaccharide biosynthesis/export family protein [Chthoniobacterales bacterium]